MADTKTFSIVKPSFWSGRREVKDRHGGGVGHYTSTSVWGSKAEFDMHGRRFRFATKGWEGTRAEMTGMSGQVVATILPLSWWGTKYTLTHAGKEYAWSPNGWGTGFSIQAGEKRIVQVKCGGYFKPGSITVEGEVPEQDALPLALFGLFYLQVYAAQMSGGGAVVAAT